MARKKTRVRRTVRRTVGAAPRKKRRQRSPEVLAARLQLRAKIATKKNNVAKAKDELVLMQKDLRRL